MSSWFQAVVIPGYKGPFMNDLELRSNRSPKKRKTSDNGCSRRSGSPDEMGGPLTPQDSGSTDELAREEESTQRLPYRRSFSKRDSLTKMVSPTKPSNSTLQEPTRDESPDELAPSNSEYASDREHDRMVNGDSHQTSKLDDETLHGRRSWSRSPIRVSPGGGNSMDRSRHSTPLPSRSTTSTPRKKRSRSASPHFLVQSSSDRSPAVSPYKRISRSRSPQLAPNYSPSPVRSNTSSPQKVFSRSRSPSPKPVSSPSPSNSATSTPRAASPHRPITPETLIQTPKFHPYKHRQTLKSHTSSISSVKISPSSKLLATSSSDATIKIWSLPQGTLLQTLRAHLAGINTIAWSPDSITLASGSDDKSIRLWNTSTGKCYPSPLRGHHNYVSALAFSPKGNILVSGSYDEAVFLWDVRSGRLLRSLPAHQDPVSGVDFVWDGTLIASCGSGDGLIRIWDTHTGQCLKTMIHADNAAVMGVRFSPNGRFVLGWTLDGCVRLWDYGEGRVVKTYQGHVNGKYGLGGGFGVYGDVYDSDDEEEEANLTNEEVEGQRRRGAEGGGRKMAFAVSGSEDGAILFWDVVSKEILQRIEGAHRDCVISVDTCDKTKIMVSGGLDGVVKVWEMVKEVKEIKDRPDGEGDGKQEMEEQVEPVGDDPTIRTEEVGMVNGGDVGDDVQNI